MSEMLISQLHSQFITILGQYIGYDYLQANQIALDIETRFDRLNLNIIDECWIERMISTHYDLVNFTVGSWPETIGDLLVQIEQEFNSTPPDGSGFADNPNLIFLSYAGGACGHALRYLLLLSPDTDGNDANDDFEQIDDLGSAHHLVSRSGIGHWKGQRLRKFALNEVPDMLRISPFSWYDNRQSFKLVRYARHMINNSRTFRNEDTRNFESFGSWIWSDHIPPCKARQVFPNAKIAALRRNTADLCRDFIIKFQLEPIDRTLADCGYDPQMTRMEYMVSRNFDQKVNPISRDSYREFIRFQINWQVHMQEVILEDATNMGIHVVDIDRLLDPSTWQDEYLTLCGNLGLQPDIRRAGLFLQAYRNKQYDRSAWQPSLRWPWVGMGPNIAGRW